MSADLLAKLIEAGTPAALIAEVAMALGRAEAAVEAIETRRAKDRARKAVPRNSTESAECAETLSPFVPPKKAPTPQKITPPISPNPDLVVSSETPPPAEQIEDSGVKPEHVIEAWNMTAEPIGLPLVRKMTPERRRKLNTFIRRHSIDEITEGISAIGRSPFLRGENARGWRADFDWMTNPTNFTKLTEGTYDR